MFMIETERLTITEFTPDMAQAVHENSLDEDNRRFVPDEVFETVEEAAETIGFLMSQYGSNVLKDSTNIGYVQAVPLDDGVWEIGFHIGILYTKKGYATEAVKAFLPVIMKRLGIGTISGICLSENIASRKVMEKSGFVLDFEGEGDYQGEKKNICKYHFTLG